MTSKPLRRNSDTLRLRAKPLDNPLPWRRGRSGYQRAVRVLTAVEYYLRVLARLAGQVADPEWTSTLQPAAERVGDNLNALRRAIRDREQAAIHPAEEHAARTTDPRRRAYLLDVARMLRRIDQAVVGFAQDLAERDRDEAAAAVPRG